MRDVSYLGLPESITDKVVLTPIEEIPLKELRERLPDLPIFTLVAQRQEDLDYWCLLRQVNGNSSWHGDPRFINHSGLTVEVFTRDPDGEEKAVVISEAVRASLFDMAKDRTYHPGLGSILRVRMVQEPNRKTDWATSTGPVQYADLPRGVWRYEAIYDLWVRKPLDAWDAKHPSD